MIYKEMLVHAQELIQHQLNSLPDEEGEKEVEDFSIIFSEKIHLVIKPGLILDEFNLNLIKSYQEFYNKNPIVSFNNPNV